ncbi:MAG: 4Fe-4S binding protein [Oscillospiraceae bacterium]|nr:4Fe-4S binding protein [Oscillospiraceae bacterium]
MAFRIDKEKCVGCGLCADTCPQGIISEEDGHYVIDEESCVSCGACAGECPQEAIAEA